MAMHVTTTQSSGASSFPDISTSMCPTAALMTILGKIAALQNSTQEQALSSFMDQVNAKLDETNNQAGQVQSSGVYNAIGDELQGSMGLVGSGAFAVIGAQGVKAANDRYSESSAAFDAYKGNAGGDVQAEISEANAADVDAGKALQNANPSAPKPVALNDLKAGGVKAEIVAKDGAKAANDPEKAKMAKEDYDAKMEQLANKYEPSNRQMQMGQAASSIGQAFGEMWKAPFSSAAGVAQASGQVHGSVADSNGQLAGVAEGTKSTSQQAFGSTVANFQHIMDAILASSRM